MRKNLIILLLFPMLLAAHPGRARASEQPSLTNADIENSVQRVLSLMAPATATLPRKLKYIRKPDAEYFSLSVSGFDELTLEVNGSATIAQAEGLNSDGLLLLLCHEIGHVAGGTPTRPFIFRDIPFSVEGQADFFAASACFPHLIANEDNSNFIPKLAADPALRTACAEEESSVAKALCARTALASLNAARHLHQTWDAAFMRKDAGPLPELGRPDLSEVTFTNESHPLPQCRLDTFLAGFSCRTDAPVSFTAQRQASTRCGPAATAPRPACWFRKR